jgi:streptogramin lyase
MLAAVPEPSRDPWDFADLYIFRKDQSGWQPHKILENFARGFSVDSAGAVLFSCPAGWCELSRQQILDWPRAELHPRGTSLGIGAAAGVGRILRDRSGCLWYRGNLFVTYQCPNQPPTTIPDSSVGLDESAQISEAPDGEILMLGPGIAMGRPGDLHVARAINGIPGGSNTAVVGRDGTIFIGANSGLYRFMYPFRLEFWTQADGVDNPFSILRTGDKILASNSGIRQLDSTRERWNEFIAPRDVGTAVHMLSGSDKTIYVASLLRGVTEFNLDGKLLAQSTWGPGGARLASDMKGHTWLAGTGVTSIIRQGNKLELAPMGVPNTTALDMEYDSKHGRLWACFDREILMIENRHATRLSKGDGLTGDYCHTVAVMSDGDVWVAYGTDTALSLIRRETPDRWKIVTYPAETEKQNGSENFLDSDSRGWLWRASVRHNYVATTGNAAKNAWLALDEQDGIPRPGGNQNSFFSDADGSVWFGSENTIVHFRPRDDFATRFPPPQIFIAGITMGSDSPAPADAISSLPHGRSVTAHVGSLQFDRRNALHFRYRLLPAQKDWTETDSFDLPLGKLSPGSHTLEIQGRLLTGEWSSPQSTVFTVLWPIWLSWPVLVMVGAGGGGIGLGALQWRRQRKRNRELTLPDISSWRMGAFAPDAERLIGSVVDSRYEIDHILSVGGFATVARARDLRESGELCAVKVFRYDIGDRDWIRHRFEHEVAALEQVSHPNIVRITGHGIIDPGAPYLVMEFIRGRSVRQVLEQGPLPASQIATFMGQLAGALASLHQRSIYHRDIKPENLMVRIDASGEEQIVLIDFSIAIVKAPDHTIHGISRVAGTIGYMAPEQVTGYADSSTDIHSLAKLFLELLTGMPCSELMPQATVDLPAHVREYFGANPGRLTQESIDQIAGALAFDPKHRPHDVTQFVAPIIRDLSSNP